MPVETESEPINSLERGIRKAAQTVYEAGFAITYLAFAEVVNDQSKSSVIRLHAAATLALINKEIDAETYEKIIEVED